MLFLLVLVTMLVLVGLTAITIAAFLLLPTGWMTAWKLGGDMPEDDGDGEAS